MKTRLGANDGISFIHLSDIHFNKWSGDKYDIDKDLRNQILIDIKREAKPLLGNVRGVLICGDIAFSGQAGEYDVAQTFLRNICKVLSVPETSVLCVPGNHDVDQNIISDSPALYRMQKDIEGATSAYELTKKLSTCLRDRCFPNALFAHVETYNENFAGKYGCNIDAAEPNWQQDFPLSNGFTLRVYGLNSIIISNRDDTQNCNDKLMVIGEYQIPKREERVIYLTLCHHPPECWSSLDNVTKSKLNRRVAVQLYGHKHLQEIKRIENTIVVGSGATHPDRGQPDWLPRYNWLTLFVNATSPVLTLTVRIYPRVLDSECDCFVADSKMCKGGGSVEYTLEIPNGTYNRAMTIADKEVAANSCEDNVHAEGSVKQIEFDTKTLVYRFLELPYVIRCTVLLRLRLADASDEGVSHVKMMSKVLSRAKTLGCLDQLWEEVNNYSKTR